MRIAHAVSGPFRRPRLRWLHHVHRFLARMFGGQ